MGKTAKKYAVIVVGHGVTGLSTAFHLAKIGIHNGLIIGDAGGVSQLAAGSLQGSHMDNFTRLVTAHGADFARDFWAFGERAFDATQAFLQQNNVSCQRGRRLRFVVSPEELVEVKEAVSLLHDAGFAATLRSPVASDRVTSRVLAIQDDGDRSASVKTGDFLAAIDKGCSWTKRTARVRSINSHAAGVSLAMDDGTSLEAETVVLANHNYIGAHIPSLRQAFVPIADQYLIVNSNKLSPVLQKAGYSLSCFHGYEWGVTYGANSLAWGGGRFLRPLAGIGAQTAVVEEKVTQYLLNSLVKTFDGLTAEDLSVSTAYAGLDCRPCDELPIIGPMFGDNRILMAGGYSGTGLTLGFYAGKCLADLLHTGRCNDLPHRLWPQRLRSLS